LAASAVSAGVTNLGAGVTNADPFFASASVPYDVHLKSLYGRWDPTAGGWTTDAVQSPCIDAGTPYDPADPATFFAHEPMPNGGRVNLGRYGNTAQASKSRGGRGFLIYIK
jgi:hypothetical protein